MPFRVLVNEVKHKGLLPAQDHADKHIHPVIVWPRAGKTMQGLILIGKI